MCVYDSFKKLNLEASSLMMKWCVFLLKRTFPNTLFVFGFSSVLFTISLSSLSLSLFGGSRKKRWYDTQNISKRSKETSKRQSDLIFLKGLYFGHPISLKHVKKRLILALTS